MAGFWTRWTPAILPAALRRVGFDSTRGRPLPWWPTRSASCSPFSTSSPTFRPCGICLTAQFHCTWTPFHARASGPRWWTRTARCSSRRRTRCIGSPCWVTLWVTYPSPCGRCAACARSRLERLTCVAEGLQPAILPGAVLANHCLQHGRQHHTTASLLSIHQRFRAWLASRAHSPLGRRERPLHCGAHRGAGYGHARREHQWYGSRLRWADVRLRGPRQTAACRASAVT